VIAGFAAAAVLALAGAPQPRALVVTETAGFHHPSIPAAAAALQRLGDESPDFDVVAVASSSSLTTAALRGADAVVFLSTTGELRMGATGLRRLLRWIRGGGGFVGLHAASNTFDSEPAFARMLGAQFKAHPFVGRGRVIVTDAGHPAMRGLPRSFAIDDEFYVFQTSPRRRAHVLARRATKADEPLVWWRREGRGRVFYSALGHPDSAWSDATHLRLVAGGLRWAAGSRQRSRPLTSGSVGTSSGRRRSRANSSAVSSDSPSVAISMPSSRSASFDAPMITISTPA
jgi:type 1 glutamine amidotransferase